MINVTLPSSRPTGRKLASSPAYVVTVPAPEAPRPNVVLINCDDLGYGDLGCYGSTLNATPALDRMAAEGLRLDSFYMASPVCSPSRGALLTGCYPPRIGFGDFDGLPVLFPGQACGLAPVRDQPRPAARRRRLPHGDGRQVALRRPAGVPADRTTGSTRTSACPTATTWAARPARRPTTAANQRGYPPLPLMLDDEVLEQQPDQRSLTARYLAEAVRFIRRPDDRPFFLYLAHMYVHLPIYVQERFALASRNGAYGAAVEAIDWVTAVILHELRTRGLDESTIVIFTSDNGIAVPATAAATPRCAEPRARRGRAACACRASSAGPATSRPGARQRRADRRRSTCSRPSPRCAAPSCRTTARSTASTCRTCCSTPAPPSPRRGVLVLPDERPRGGAGRALEAAHRQGRARRSTSSTTSSPTRPRRPTGPPSTPAEVARLGALADDARRSLGDARLGIVGDDIRPIGRVADARPLTTTTRTTRTSRPSTTCPIAADAVGRGQPPTATSPNCSSIVSPLACSTVARSTPT